MSGEVLVAVLTALGLLITALGVQVRSLTGERFQRKVDAAAALLSGYTQQVASLQAQLQLCEEVGAKALLASRDHARRNAATVMLAHETERDAWNADKADLKAEIARLNERLDDLMTQVYVLRNPPREAPE